MSRKIEVTAEDIGLGFNSVQGKLINGQRLKGEGRKHWGAKYAIGYALRREFGDIKWAWGICDSVLLSTGRRWRFSNGRGMSVIAMEPVDLAVNRWSTNVYIQGLPARIKAHG